VDRDREPPGTLVKAALAAREKKQPLSLEWLASAARLPHTRLGKLWVHAPAAQRIVPQFQSLLRFYGSLSPSQRAALAAGEELPAERLEPPQRETMRAAVTGIAREWKDGAVARSRIRLTQSPQQARFVFTADGKPVEVAIPLPSAAPSRPGPLGGPPFPPAPTP
jgi:hypothetical protein